MDTRRKNALRYALNNRCPRCGQAPIIPSLFRIHSKCAHCHFQYDRGDGFFTGALPINYSLVCVLWIVPLMALWFCDLIPNWACLPVWTGCSDRPHSTLPLLPMHLARSTTA